MDFKELFHAIKGYNPYPWQTRLYNMFLSNEFPRTLDIPTGLGKTSVMAIWLLALAESSNTGTHIPTRLVYIVDRRVIVDQASVEASGLRDSVKKGTLDKITHLNISKLRGGGGMADTREWLVRPDVPAIVIGTTDMIGSRLLFSGYGVSNKIRSFYAGLLGQDTLIVLDETHLSPAMERVLKNVERISEHVSYRLRPPKILLMSATQRFGHARDTFTLDSNDHDNKEIMKRYESEKNLKLVEADDVVQKVVEYALNKQGKVLIYLQKPRSVQEVASRLKKSGECVATLTGTMRGFERDSLVKNTVYKKFESAEKPSGRCFLVSTSAGEVGADLDADHMVCDLTTLDSLIQRLGRVNRSGGRRSEITVVYSEDLISKNKSLKEQLKETRDILKDLAGAGYYNANPANLSRIDHDRKFKAFTATPETQPLTPDILGMWSMTSLYNQYSSRPSVKYWLRGNPERTIPETHVVWRDDVEYLTKLEENEILDVLDAYRTLPHETARDNTDNVYRILRKMRNAKAIIISNDACSIKDTSKISKKDIEFATLLLPCSLGGLNEDGLLDTAKRTVKDVTDDKSYVKRARILAEIGEDGRHHIERIFGGVKKEQTDKELDGWLEKNPRMRLVHSSNVGKHEDEDMPSVVLQYYVEKPDQQQSSSAGKQKLCEHLDAVEKCAKRIAKNLNLPACISEAVVTSARFHDIGKEEKHWQQCMHVAEEDMPLAKTGKRIKPLPLGGFRHELASVIKCSTEKEISEHKERDLILHLIAAHHGWARPCFRPNALITEDSTGELVRTMQRYASLQNRFGAWGLAWLEGLVRGADWDASSALDNGGGHAK